MPIKYTEDKALFFYEIIGYKCTEENYKNNDYHKNIKHVQKNLESAASKCLLTNNAVLELNKA